ncbi:hypothetical protein NKH77_32175 [Streptomyces sp. M19]
MILPYGPAALSTSDREIPVPGAMFGIEEDSATGLRQLQLAVPLVNGTHTAVFAFSTEDADQWDNYLQVIARCCARSRGRAGPGHVTVVRGPMAETERRRVRT